MNFANFREKTSPDIFDYQMFKDFFKGLKKPRDKLSSLLREGKVIRIKKGLYVFGKDWRRGSLDLELVANLIYGPSCVSFEYALFRYGLLAESPTVITSLTLGKSKHFDTPLGLFEYRALDKEKFKVGIEYRNLGETGGYFIASREKALADLVYRTAGIRSLEGLRSYLFEEMRVDEIMFRQLDRNCMENIAKVYRKRSVSMMLQI